MGCPASAGWVVAGSTERGRVMPHAETLRTLVHELKRVGVDADHVVAGLSARADDAIRALRALPDGAGPAAFLARLRSDSGSSAANDMRDSNDLNAPSIR